MTVLITVETVVLVLLALLVGGLLRSHAEILRRLDELGSRAAGQPPPAAPPEGPPRGREDLVPPAPYRNANPAPDIAGTTLDGGPVKIAVAAGGQSTLIAFLSSGCSTCGGFWEAFGSERREPLPGGARLVVVTRDSSHESPSRLRELAPPDVPLAMSSAAWDAYEVPLTPYFVLVDGATGQVHGEGAAEAWPQIRSLLRDALEDRRMVAARAASPTPGEARNGSVLAALDISRSRAERIDQDLSEAGIGPEHPSLYQAGDPDLERD